MYDIIIMGHAIIFQTVYDLKKEKLILIILHQNKVRVRYYII